MKDLTFSDRAAASAAAKKALLAQFKPKAAVQAAEPINHEAERQARIEAIRKQRLDEKDAKMRAREEAAAAAEQARIEAEAAAAQAKLDAQLSTDAMKRAERKDRKKAIKEAARLKKESRAEGPRASSSGGREERALDPMEEHLRYIRSLERKRA